MCLEPMPLHLQEFVLQAPGADHGHIKYFVGKFSGVSLHRPYSNLVALCVLLSYTISLLISSAKTILHWLA